MQLLEPTSRADCSSPYMYVRIPPAAVVLSPPPNQQTCCTACSHPRLCLLARDSQSLLHEVSSFTIDSIKVRDRPCPGQQPSSLLSSPQVQPSRSSSGLSFPPSTGPPLFSGPEPTTSPRSKIEESGNGSCRSNTASCHRACTEYTVLTDAAPAGPSTWIFTDHGRKSGLLLFSLLVSSSVHLPEPLETTPYSVLPTTSTTTGGSNQADDKQDSSDRLSSSRSLSSGVCLSVSLCVCSACGCFSTASPRKYPPLLLIARYLTSFIAFLFHTLVQRRRGARLPLALSNSSHRPTTSPLCPGFVEGSLPIISQSAKNPSQGVDLVRCTGRRAGQPVAFN